YIRQNAAVACFVTKKLRRSICSVQFNHAALDGRLRLWSGGVTEIDLIGFPAVANHRQTEQRQKNGKCFHNPKLPKELRSEPRLVNSAVFSGFGLNDPDDSACGG